MNDVEYTDTYKDKDGQIHNVVVPSLENCLYGITKRFDSANCEINALQKENKKLKEKLQKAEEDLCRGFPVTKDEENSIRDWTKAHCIEEHPSEYWNLTYEFIPNGEGFVGKVICSCGEEFCFKNQ